MFNALLLMPPLFDKLNQGEVDPLMESGVEETGPLRGVLCRAWRFAGITIRFGEPIKKAMECNLMELDETPATYHEHQLTFAINPFEIKTFKVWL